MDAQEYDRIADLLMQIRKKYANMKTKTEQHIENKQNALDYLNALLYLNDLFAEDDAKGWL